MANSRTPGELKNCKLENPSLLFWYLAQYLGSKKRRVLSPCVTYHQTCTMHIYKLVHTQLEAIYPDLETSPNLTATPLSFSTSIPILSHTNKIPLNWSAS